LREARPVRGSRPKKRKKERRPGEAKEAASTEKLGKRA